MSSNQRCTNIKLCLRQLWMMCTNAIMMICWFHVLIIPLTTILVSSYHHHQNNTYNHNHHHILSIFCNTNDNNTNTNTNNEFIYTLQIALLVSFLEVFNAMIGITRSKVQQVLLFAIIRYGIEYNIGSQLIQLLYLLQSSNNNTICNYNNSSSNSTKDTLSSSTTTTTTIVLLSSYIHLFTILCWSFGDSIRFGCFFIDSCYGSSNNSSSSSNSSNNNNINNKNYNYGSYIAKYIRYTIGPIIFPIGTLGEMGMVLSYAYYLHNMNMNTQKLSLSISLTLYRIYFMYFAAIILWPIGFYSLFIQLLKQRQKFIKQSIQQQQQHKDNRAVSTMDTKKIQ